ncbi:MAG: EAL domain-containing protein [Treponema sp.]|nr:EAL domain-containing protein [Treponema sp.]
MLFFKDVYFVTSIILLFLLVCGTVDCLFKKSRFSKLSASLQETVIISVVFFLAAMLTKHKLASEILYGFFLGSLDFTMYVALYFVYHLDGTKKISPLYKKRIYFCLGLATIDSLINCTNLFHHLYFSIKPVYLNDVLFCWAPSYTPFMHIHLFVMYLIAFYTLILLYRIICSVSKIYRHSFISLSVFYILVLLLNGCYVSVFRNLYLDFSLIFYELMAFIAYIFIIYIMPVRIKNNLFSIAGQDLSDGILCFDNQMRCIYKNTLGEKIYKDDEQSNTWVNQYFEKPEDFIRTTEVFEIDGEMHFFKLEFCRIKDKAQKFSGYYFKLNDRTNEVKNLEQAQYRATHDELTGVYNRSSFFKEVERILKSEPDDPRYLIGTDIKHFKLLNDLFGTQFADNILKQQVAMLYKANYPGCIYGRISADRFAMLIPKKYFNPKYAIENTSKIKDIAKGVNFNLRFFVGVYEISDSHESVNSMWNKVCLAIKHNDNENNVLCFYDTSLMNKLIEEKNVISAFEYALKQNQFCMFVQPQIDSSTQKCIGGEILTRWRDVDGGYRQPSSFIPILEEAGLIFKLDYYMWELAVKKLHEWKSIPSLQNLNLSVNISVKDFYYGDLYKIFTELVERYEVSPAKLHLEITESMIIGDKHFYRSILDQLKSYGFIIEMDDFGSGYSSLNALKEMNMDVLKIDMGFLKKSENEVRGRIIIDAIVKMAKDLGMRIISEGVETSMQIDFLKKCGVDVFQGFYYSKPLPIADFEKKFAEDKK